jgi:hypothetical protein
MDELKLKLPAGVMDELKLKLPAGVMDELKLKLQSSFIFNSSMTPAGSNLGEYYQKL